jgi:DNA polymerase I-like protein with 3'-5' exonuclease and polymerase domains
LDEFTGGINPRSVPQVREFVYETLKFKPKMKGKGRNATPIYSTKTEDLLALKATTKKQKQFVELKKNYSMYNADVTKNLLFFNSVVTDPDKEDPIFFAQFNQCVTVTHRLSSSGINRTFKHVLDDKGKPITKSVQFQNFKREFKPIMCARNPGWSMGEADGSQLEFRVAGFMGQCRTATQEIIDGVDVHVQSASVINDVAKDKVTGAMRTAAKADTFKPLFGGQSGTEGQVKYYEWFAKHYDGVANAQQNWIDQALVKKKVKLPHGFTFYFPHCKMNASGYVSQSTNIKNYPIQHFATGEIIPIAVVYLWHLMRTMKSFLVNTVHDSAISELHPDEHAEFSECSKYAFTYLVYHYLKEVYNVEFNVPLGIGVKIGPNWGKGEEYACSPMPPFKMKGIDYSKLNTDWVKD